jgi:prepilin-type N-terminal cleavage/methylation domain-containing protein
MSTHSLYSKILRPQQAFSLLELMAVVTLIAVIAAIVVSRVTQSTDAAKCKACRHNRLELNAAIERYHLDNGSFPANLSDVATTNYLPAGLPVCPVSGAAYSLNSATHRIDGHTIDSVPGDH